MNFNNHNSVDLIQGYQLGEKISESNLHAIYEATRENDGEEIVIKILIDKYPKKENIASLKREYQILSGIQFDGIIKAHALVPFGQGNVAIVMERFGISLAKFLSSSENGILQLNIFFSIAIPLVRLLGNLHQKKIIHKDINPANILINPDTFELKLIDFSSSTELYSEQQDFNLTKNISGSLPYMSPEQTGRMNRSLDYRTDYYSLGITFYQLLTGKFPFVAEDALEWVHMHISKHPKPVNKVNRMVPAALSAIVAKLISKNSEDRYQSSFGLVTDLEKCRAEINKGYHDFDFELAHSDISNTFQIPQKLFGRDHEFKKLEIYFENASLGSVEFCLVSGYSGLGKSVLVQELGRSIVKKRGNLIQGKFEQFKQNIAYVAFANAFRNLIYQILGETQQSLDNWSAVLRDALGANAQLLIDLIPELELIIDKQSSVQELTPQEAQNRFLMLLQSFVKVFATKDHPLVLFMDDLQWSDIPTLNLLQRLVTSQELGYLFIIGAYRDNAVDTMHPLTLTIEEIKNKRFVENLQLEPLNEAGVNQIVMGALHCNEQRAMPLSKTIFEKTGGNPFFTIEMLKDFNKQEIIHFNPIMGQWEWDIDAIKYAKNSDNVVDFLVASQSRLHKNTQHVMQLAACIGATFDLETLSIIQESSMQKTAKDLNEALLANMVIPLSDNYKFVGLGESEILDHASSKAPENSEEFNQKYRFQHDRVQQAAYSMIEPGKRQALHLSIGRLILRHASLEKTDELLLDVVGHLNEGRVLITDAAEQLELAHLNLKAGVKAKQSSAYEAALKYLKTGYEILNKDAWEIDYFLAWKLSHEIQHCTYLTGDWKEADYWTETMLEHSKTPFEKALVLSARTRQYATIGKPKESIRAACEGLSFLGFDFSLQPSAENVMEETKLVEENLKGRAISDLINMSNLEDPNAKIASQLLMETFAAAFLSGSGQMFPYLVLKSVNLALCYGNSPEMAFAYAAYGMLLCGYLDDTAQGYEYGKLSVALIEKFDEIALKSRIYYVYTMFVHHWSNHWKTMTPWFRKGIETGYQSGDLLYLAYSAQDCIIWDPQLDLETASIEHRKLLKIVKECEYQDSYDSGTLFLQMQLNFMGLTEGKYSLTDENFNETERVNGMQERHFMTGIANYNIYKAEIYFMYNDALGALPFIQQMEHQVSSVMSLPQLVRFYIISFLVYANLLSQVKEEERSLMKDKMQRALSKISNWSKQCPENFEHLRLLMEAELAAHTKNMEEVVLLYEQSIAAAKKNSFIRDEAMVNEMAGRYYLRLGLNKSAEGYLYASRYLYYRWDAKRKVEDMDQTYGLHTARFMDTSSSFSHNNKAEQNFNKLVTGNGNSNLLDMNSVFKASQTISGELLLDKLLKETIQILVENAGAQKGFLMEEKDGQIIVLAKNEEEIAGTDNKASENSGLGNQPFPVSMVNTSFRTNESIIIDNASEINLFSSDPYVMRVKPLSVMCVPLPLHNKWKAAVYLENNLTHSAFSEDRVKIIKLLVGQAAISIANARIFEEQKNLLKAQQRFVPSQFLKNLGHEDISRVELGESVSMDMSVLFSDLIGFTSMAELLSPHDVIKLLNEYYSALGISVTNAGGFIDSYAGDEIMALFPVPAHLSVRAGVSMCDALRDFNEKLQSQGRPKLKMGIGMNSGPLVLGTMGGVDRMQCSVLGDTVNIASRIEQLTRIYDAQFLIGENTYKSLINNNLFSIRMVDYVAVKGKSAAIKLYEVIDAADEERRRCKESSKEQLLSGMEAYYKRDFLLASSIFSDMVKYDPLDPVPSIFLSRCDRYIKQAPSEDWKGYEKLQHK